MGGWGGGIGTEGESERTRERVGMTERDRREEEGGGEEEIKRKRLYTKYHRHISYRHYGECLEMTYGQA